MGHGRGAFRAGQSSGAACRDGAGERCASTGTGTRSQSVGLSSETGRPAPARSAGRNGLPGRGFRRRPQRRRSASAPGRRAHAMTSMTIGVGWIPSTPVSSDASGVPGRTSQVRSTACACPKLIQPASCAVWTAVITRPAATSTSTTLVKREEAGHVEPDPAVEDAVPEPDRDQRCRAPRRCAGRASRCRWPGRSPAGRPRSRSPRAARRGTP